MTLNPFDPEGRFYWGLGFLAMGAIFAVLGVLVTFNAVSFAWRAEPVDVVVVDLVEREGQNSTLLAPVLEAVTADGPIRDLSSAASLRPLHRLGDRVQGFIDPAVPRIETEATLRAMRRLGYALGTFGLGLGLFGLYLLRRPKAS
ncbi:MAG: DUF3592 domain-containing protein [Pseudomonadota bacterium]